MPARRQTKQQGRSATLGGVPLCWYWRGENSATARMGARTTPVRDVRPHTWGDAHSAPGFFILMFGTAPVWSCNTPCNSEQSFIKHRGYDAA